MAHPYGYQHKKLRKAWATIVNAGLTNCYRCGHPINPGEPWHLDHTNPLALGGGTTKPSHATCNTTHGAQLRHQLTQSPLAL